MGHVSRAAAHASVEVGEHVVGENSESAHSLSIRNNRYHPPRKWQRLRYDALRDEENCGRRKRLARLRVHRLTLEL